MSATNQINLFYSYAHADTILRDELDKHLSLLRRSGFIAQWYDRNINAGTEWAAQIDQHLNTAQIILLLISSDFLASSYCYSIEMNRALERHLVGEARVIPILLRPVDWQDAPFAKLQMLPQNASPVTSWNDRDLAFRDIAIQLRKVVKELQMNQDVYEVDLSPNNTRYSSQADGKSEEINRNVQGEHAYQYTSHAFSAFRRCQDQVSELKSIHNMLHEIEVELEGLSATVQLVLRSERERKSLRSDEEANQYLPNFDYVEIIWRQVVLKIDYLVYFAAKEIKALEDERFRFNNDLIGGAPWVKDLFILQRSFEIEIGNHNMDAIKKLSNELLTKCRSHLYHIDKRLLNAVKELDLSSNFILRDRI